MGPAPRGNRFKRRKVLQEDVSKQKQFAKEAYLCSANLPLKEKI